MYNEFAQTLRKQGLILSRMTLLLCAPAAGDVRLNMENSFLLRQTLPFPMKKIGDYYTGVRHVLTKIFGSQEVLAYVTATEKEHGTKRLYFSTIFPEELQIFCACQEKAPLIFKVQLSRFFGSVFHRSFDTIITKFHIQHVSLSCSYR